MTKQISKDYDVLIDGAGIALRGTFIIDKNGIIRQKTVNDLPIGRSVDETLRLIKALQFFENHGEGSYNGRSMKLGKFEIISCCMFQFVQLIGIRKGMRIQLSPMLRDRKSTSKSRAKDAECNYYDFVIERNFVFLSLQLKIS